MRAKFVVNVENETLLYRTDATDELPVIYRKIDDETAKAIIKNEITVKQVVDAIQNSEMRSPNFSWRDYDAKMRAAKKRLNVSEKNMTPVNETTQGVVNREDNPSDVVKFADIIGGEPAPGSGGEGGGTSHDVAAEAAAAKAAAAMGVPAKPATAEPEPANKPSDPEPANESESEPEPKPANEGQEPAAGSGARHVRM